MDILVLLVCAAFLNSICLGIPLDSQATGGLDGSVDPKSAASRTASDSSSSSDSEESSSSPSSSSLTRLSFSDLQGSSSSSYSSTCCDVLPELCDDAGKCKLNVSDCVSFCICARSSELPWCPGQMERLRQILGNQGLSPGTHQQGSGEAQGAGEPHGAGGSSPLGGQSLLGSLPLGSVPLGGSPAGQTSGGVPGQDTRPTGTLSSGGTFPGSMFGSLGSLNLPSLNTAAGSLGGSSPDSHDSGSLTHPFRHAAPPMAAMMDGGEGGNSGGSGSGGVGSIPSLDTLTSVGTNLKGANSTAQPSDGLHDRNASDDFWDLSLHPNNNNTTNFSDPTPSTLLGDDWCGPECELSGGRCVLGADFKPQCVRNLDPNPCHSFLCMHGTCMETEGKYSCRCEENWVGVRCEKECPLDCGENGYCGRVQNGSIACICQWNYTGEWCDELWPEWSAPYDGYGHGDVVTVWQIAAGCLGAAAITLLLLVLAAYVTWRQQWLPMRKLVHYFQHYEEDDGKEYDAFISYKSSARDEKFVLQQLYPRLEKDLDFKLCMHFRDFPPGETIADNIIQAIENSRRTIMVLSPAYVESEWCRLEYQKAQHEMLKLKHKIIPVVLEDAEHICASDKNLKTILDTVTYIKWPGVEDSKKTEKFWKLLELSMPKKKSDYSRSLSSQGSCSSDRPLTSVSASCFNQIVENMSGTLYPQRSLSLSSAGEEESELTDRDRADSQATGDGRSLSGSDGDPPSHPPAEISADSAPHALEELHVTSDDHIVEIRELSGNRVRVKPWVPARLAPPVEVVV